MSKIFYDTFYFIPMNADGEFVDAHISSALDATDDIFPANGLDVLTQAMVYVDGNPVCIIQTAIPVGSKKHHYSDEHHDEIDAICTFFKALGTLGKDAEIHNFDQHGGGSKRRYLEAAVNLAHKHYGISNGNIETINFDNLKDMYIPTPCC